MPLLRFAPIRVDVKAIRIGLLPGRTTADCVERAYNQHLFHGAGLQDIPDASRSTFIAMNLQTGIYAAADGLRGPCEAHEFEVGTGHLSAVFRIGIDFRLTKRTNREQIG